MAGMASIVLTDSDGEPEILSDVEDHRQHANTGHRIPPLSPRKQHVTQPFPPSQRGNSSSSVAHYYRSAANSSHQSPSPASHHLPAASSCHPPPSVLLCHPINLHGLGCGKQHLLLQEALELLQATSKNSMLLQTVELWVYSLSGMPNFWKMVLILM